MNCRKIQRCRWWSMVAWIAILGGEAQAAISLDRTRVIFPQDSNSIALTISNDNPRLPYLAQAWVENARDGRDNVPFTVQPPLQRVEPGSKSMVRLSALPAVALLPQDRESLFYFNLREIPPKSSKPNVMQLALQTKVKLFYRPAQILDGAKDGQWAQKLTLQRMDLGWKIENPTPYHANLVDLTNHASTTRLPGFRSVMVAPFSSTQLDIKASLKKVTLSFINDYGGTQTVPMQCTAIRCQAEAS
ncbi:fimbria/pilus periplasmic chaperone [Aeromonas sobria]|jgi:chaperone protein PapD|nr:fimbria/pilus periplasmic chaperone [Aeromonas sobria]